MTGQHAGMGPEKQRLATGCVVVGHRGASGRAPENTQDSFRLAAAVGVTAVETDVRRARDGTLVLIHDATVDRTSDGSGRVCDLALDDLLQLDMGSWFGPDFVGERILTLENGLSLFKSLAVQPVLEIKEPETCADVAAEVRRHGLESECHIVSFLSEAVTGIKQAAPGMTATLILDPRLELFRQANVAEAIVSAAKGCGADGVGLFHLVASRKLVAAVHQNQIAVSILLVNRLEDIRAAVELEVEAVLTDFPDRGRRVILEKGERREAESADPG